MLALLMSLMACELSHEEHVCNRMYSPSTLTLELTADWSGEVAVDVSGVADPLAPLSRQTPRSR